MANLGVMSLQRAIIRFAIFATLLSAPTPAFTQSTAIKPKIGIVLATQRSEELDEQVFSVVTDALFFSRRFTVVERRQLESVFSEKNLQEFLGGKVNSDLSRTLDLDLLAIVGYSSTVRHGRVRWTLTVRLIDVRDATIIASVRSERGLRPRSLRKAGEALQKGLREAFSLQGQVVHVDGALAIVDLGEKNGLLVGDLLEIARNEGTFLHPATEALWPRPSLAIGELRVVATSEVSSRCVLVSGEVRVLDTVHLHVARRKTVSAWFRSLGIGFNRE